MIVGKLLEGREKNILVVCDKNLLGRVFSKGEFNLNVDKDFYGEESITKEEIEKVLPMADILNLCGEKTLKVFLELGFEFENVIRIENIPHIQVILV